MASLRVFGTGGRFLGRSIEISLTKSKEGLVLGCQSPLTPVTQVIARPPKHLRVIGLPLRIGFSRATIQSPYVCSRATSQSNRSEADKAFDKHTPNILDAFEVKTLLMKICDTSIAEFELKLKDFKLYVRRDTSKMDLTSPPTNYTTLATGGKTESINSSMPVNPPAPDSLESRTASTALSLYKQPSTQKLLDTFDDESMYLVTSPTVGMFKRGRNRKGKTGPSLLKEGQTIKAGQVVCYVEQLGSQTPVESKVAGEVISILKTNGEAVGYGDPLISILPSFPGIKKLCLKQHSQIGTTQRSRRSKVRSIGALP